MDISILQRSSILSVLMSASFLLPATAQEAAQEPQVIPLEEWDYLGEWDTGWSVEEFMDEAQVYGVDGEEIGTIENVLIGEDNRIVAAVVEVGGFIDIGDTHVAVPWDDIQFSVHAVTVPVEEDNIGEYSLFESDQSGARQDVWKATDVLDDYARVEGKGYGYVDDLIFNNDGVLTAVIINSDVVFGGGPRAFPWNGDPAAPTYELPYDEAEVIEQAPFDREQLEGEPQ
ncbi:MAG: PRC-barrel domain-containing protein [Gammaproteobacteria bacterium]